MGARLFVRTRRGAELTATGRDFLDLSKEFVRVEAEIALKVRRYEMLGAGQLSIIANSPQPALRIIERFHRSHPDVEVDFGLYDWTRAMEMVRAQEVDLAFIVAPSAVEGLYVQPISQSRFVLYCPSAHPFARLKSVSLASLQDEALLLPETGSLTGRVVREAANAHGISLRRVVRMKTFPVMKEAILQGMGVGIFLEGSGWEEQRLVQVPIAELRADFATCLVSPKARLEHGLVARFSDHCAAEAGNGPV